MDLLPLLDVAVGFALGTVFGILWPQNKKYKADRVEVWKGLSGQWHWHRQAAGNNEIISQGEGYLTKQGALKGAFRSNPDQRKAYVRVVDPIEGESHYEVVKRSKYLSH